MSCYKEKYINFVSGLRQVLFFALNQLRFSIIIFRWKRDSSGNKITHPISGKNILQFVAIKRKDCGEWAIPGVRIKIKSN